jgi:hypothetical protein
MTWRSTASRPTTGRISAAKGGPARLLYLVMAALVAAIHVFGAASEDVDGSDEPSHDEEKEPVGNTIFNQIAVGLTRT